MFLGRFPYTIVHIPGDENCWGGLLSRWVTRPGGPVCVPASIKCAEVLFAESEKFPTKEVVRGVQAVAAGDGPTLDTALGVASLDSEGLYRVEYLGPRVIWMPAEAESLKKRQLLMGSRISEEATVVVCPSGGSRTPRGRYNDGSA